MVLTTSAGMYTGIVVSMGVSGILIAKVNWQSIFYIFGAFGCVWTVVWLTFVKSSPATDNYITAEERKYIESTLSNETEDPITEIPWKSILTSLPVWAIIVAEFSEGWGFFTIVTQMPMFLNDVLHYNVSESGLFSALPYLAMAFMLLVTGTLADYILVKKFLSTRNTRRIFTCFAFLGQAALRVGSTYSTDPLTSMILLSIGVALAAFAASGYTVNYLEVAPPFSGILMAISNSIATLSGIISPSLTGYIVTTRSREEWQIVFTISGLIYVVGTIFYWNFCQAEVQAWAFKPKKEHLELQTNNTGMKY